MADIVQVKGKVRYKITLDPSVWIFDDRIIDLDTYFTEPKRTEQEVDEEKKRRSATAKKAKNKISERKVVIRFLRDPARSFPGPR